MTSLPKRSASFSNVSTLSCKTFCQSLIATPARERVVKGRPAGAATSWSGQSLGVDDAIVVRRVEAAYTRGLGVPSGLIEAARRRVRLARGGLDDEQPGVPVAQPLLDLGQQSRAGAAPLRVRMRGDPIEVVCPIRTWRRSE